MAITISIVDDDAGIRTNLSKLLGRVDEFECVSTHASGEDACERLPHLSPQVVLMDINLGKMNGIESVIRVRPRMPDTQFIMLTVYEETDKILAALKAGATGYLLKRIEPEELFEGIRQVMRGESPMSGPIARKLIRNVQGNSDEASILELLTPKELEVLSLLAEGYRYREIGEKMGIAMNTVRTRIRSIYNKLEVRTKTAAVLTFLGRD